MKELPTATEIAVSEAKKNAYLEILRMLDKVTTLEEIDKIKANLEAKAQA